MDDDELVTLHLWEDVVELQPMRRGIDQLRVCAEGGWLGQPGRIPKGAHLARILVAVLAPPSKPSKEGAWRKSELSIGDPIPARAGRPPLRDSGARANLPGPEGTSQRTRQRIAHRAREGARERRHGGREYCQSCA